jgi:hypothetical protein
VLHRGRLARRRRSIDAVDHHNLGGSDIKSVDGASQFNRAADVFRESRN